MACSIILVLSLRQEDYWSARLLCNQLDFLPHNMALVETMGGARTRQINPIRQAPPRRPAGEDTEINYLERPLARMCVCLLADVRVPRDVVALTLHTDCFGKLMDVLECLQ